VYYPHDLDALRSKVPDDGVVHNDEGADSLTEDGDVQDVDVDGILSFIGTFRYSLVLAVIPDNQAGAEGEGIDVGEHPVLRRMQRILENAAVSATKIASPTGVVAVASTRQAIHAIVTMADALRPNVAELKAQYLKRQEDEMDPVESARTALSDWLGSHPGMSPEEINLLLMFTPSIGSLLENDMNNIPCDPRIKHHVRSLFQSFPHQDASSVTPSPARSFAALSPPPIYRPVCGGTAAAGPAPMAPLAFSMRESAPTATRLFVAAGQPPNNAAAVAIRQPPLTAPPPTAYYHPPQLPSSSWSQPSYALGAGSVFGTPAAGAGGRNAGGGSTYGGPGAYYVAQQQLHRPPSSSQWPTDSSVATLSAAVPLSHRVGVVVGHLPPPHLGPPPPPSRLFASRDPPILPNYYYPPPPTSTQASLLYRFQN
jgi:hypothetical protein